MSMEIQPSGQLPEPFEFPDPVAATSISYNTESEISEADVTSVLPSSMHETLPVPTEFVQPALQDLSEGIDWGKVVDTYLTDTGDVDLNRLKTLVDTCTNAIQAEGIEQYTAATDVNAIREALAAEGYALSLNERRETPMVNDAAFGEAYSTWAHAINQACPYMSSEHSEAVLALRPSRVLPKMNLHTVLGQNFEETPPAMALAQELDNKATELTGEFQAQEQALLDKAAAVPLSIEGLPLFENNSGLAEGGGELINTLLSRHPETFSRGLVSISFVDDIESQPGIENPDGAYYLDTASIEIKFTPQETVSRVVDILDHELIHHAQVRRMTTEMLSEWHDILQTEKVEITSYVAEARERKWPAAHVPLGGDEDMAESGAAYLNRPTDLLAKAPQRFAWFQKYYQSHTEAAVASMKENVAQLATTTKHATDTQFR